MAKIPRVTQKQYGLTGDASHFGEFGSRAAGSPVFTKDGATIQALTAFSNNGLKEAINAGNKAAFLEDLNSLFLLAFQQISNIFQDGIAVWDGGTSYYVGSVVRKDGTTELYGSLTNDNLGNSLPNQTANGSWTYLNPAPTQAGIVSDFAGSSAPFGWLLCDGTSYARASFPALFAAIGTNWNTYRGAGDPGGSNFRVPDLRGQTTIGAGQAPGLTNRSLATFNGEEVHTLVIGEMPQHNHGVNDGGHQHGIRTTGVGSIPAGGTPFAQPGGAGTMLTDVAPTGISIGNTGGNGAHNNMQPSAVVNKIIKT